MNEMDEVTFEFMQVVVVEFKSPKDLANDYLIRRKNE